MPHITNYAMCLYQSLHPPAEPLFFVPSTSQRLLSTQRESTQLPSQLHVTFSENEVRSNLHGRCYFIRAELQKLGATVLVRCAAMKVTDNEGVWHRNPGTPLVCLPTSCVR